MKLKRFIGLGLTLVMTLTSAATGFAEETAAIDTAAAEVIETDEITETEENSETGETEVDAEIDDTAESDSAIVVEESIAADLDGTTFESGDYTYTVTDGTVIISKYNGSDSSVTLPTSVTYDGTTYRIRTLGSSAFSGNTSLKTLVIPDGITTIENCAFKNCTSLSSVTINGDLTDCSSNSTSTSSNSNYNYSSQSVFYNAGANADFLTVTFGEGVTRVPAYLFATASSKSDGYYAHVTNVVLSSTVTEIGSYAFHYCYDMTTLNMSTGLTTIDSYAFCGCSSLTDLGWCSSLTTIGSYAFAYCTSLSNPGWKGSLETIDSYAFAYDTGLKSIELPSKLKYINEHAFDSCSKLETVVLPSSVMTLGNCVFKNWTLLSSVTINSDLTDCSSNSTSTSSNSNYNYSSQSVFYNAGANADSLTVTFGEGVTRVPAYLFATASSKSDGYDVHVTKVNLSSTVTELGSYAFYNCYDLTTLDMSTGLTTIDSYCFYGCTSLTDINWCNNLITIDSYAFAYDTGIKSIEFPSKLKYINEYAFYSCTKLETVVLSSSVTTLGNCAFKNCTFLSSVTINGDLTDCSSNSTSTSSNSNYNYSSQSVFYNAGANADFLTVTFGEGVTRVPAYLFATASSKSDGYYAHVTNVVLSSTVTEIGSYAFHYCYDMTTLNMSTGLTTIGSYAFCGCSSLTDLGWCSSLTTVGSYAFAYCTALSDPGWKGNLTTIESYAFAYDTSFKSIEFPSKLRYINEHAFDSCTKLETVVLPSSLITLEKCAFKNCTSLSSVTINSDLTDCSSNSTSTSSNSNYNYSAQSIFYNAGANCDSFTVTFGNGVTYVPAYLFATAASKADGVYAHVTSVVISDTVTSVGSYAFYHCYDLNSISIPSSVTSVGTSAFTDTNSYETVYCSRGSTADDTSLYPEGATIVYFEDMPSTESTTETTTESTTETTTKAAAETTTETTTKAAVETTTEVPTESTTKSSSETTTKTSSDPTTETTTQFVYPPSFGVAGVFGGRNVTFTSNTPGAVIYYSAASSSLTLNDTCVANGSTVLFEDFYGTLYARAYYNGSWSNVAKLILKIPVVNTPTVTASGSDVTIKSTTPSSFICYTTDGSEPVVETDGTVTNGTWLTVNGSRTNSGTITASPGNTVRAAAVRSCFTTSESAAAYVSVSPATFNVAGVFGGRNVTFTSTTSGAKIYYSSTTSSLTTSDSCIENGETVLFEDFYGTIYARAYYNGVWSNVSRLILKIPTINEPTITYENGKATIRTTTPNCHIYYTTDGTTPSTTNGKRLATNSYGQVSVSSGTTIKVIAVRNCFTNSSVVTYTVS
ncbi:MAG: leucine-rich repeat protein [Clostridiales bacterium]|nr:leucine-rich repeat protein [Clostridiales bacterium]